MAIPDSIPVSVRQLCDVAIECWRLLNVVDESGSRTTSRAARRMTGTLTELGIEILDFVGRNYDSGLVAEVIDVVDDPTFASDEARIVETVVPTVLWRGQVLEPGQVVIKRSPKRANENDGARHE
jgi:hypothetical protein